MSYHCRCSLIPVSADPVETVDTIAIEHLDADWAIPCDNDTHEEPRSAEWILYWACCEIDLVCTECKDRVVANTDPEVSCDFCGQKYTPARSALMRIEPLNRRAQ